MRLLRLAVAALLAAALVAAPAAAAGTDATFEVTTSGLLTISVPDGVVDFGAGAAGASVGGALGAVTVADNRTGLTRSWVATVESTDFVLDDPEYDGEAEATVSPAAITYDPGTLDTLVGNVLNLNLAVGTPGAIGEGRTAAELVLGVGNNSVQWNPTLSFDLLDAQVAGVYEGTITHSVSGS